ncbi:two-component sensor histidine kinase [Actinomadura sp. NBRC 104425]|uniref:sensor histidine kinase n=1 Tax=Actinomadura sp. NBRC 104425 TaxID=3032204 RepID=UPI00249FD91F|nr:sensor histidine kinase [Actinomadura sp. NBRC 104425]GLZ14215.1 two-component sensor histidine kinase [Actinomadura sp. NBRC 104425]
MDDDAPRQGLAQTLGLVLRPLVSGLVGSAEPLPADRPWPPRLRDTRLRRIPFSVVMQVIDLIIAVSIGFGTYSLLATETAKRGLQVSSGELGIAAFLLALPMALRERHPVAAWRLLCAAMFYTGMQHWLNVPFPPGGSVAGVLVLYTVAVRSPLNLTVGAGLWSVLGVLLVDRRTGGGAAVFVVVPLLVGAFVRLRQKTRDELAERERAAARELAEQRKRHREAEAVLKERQRIARELHDVVAHHMSMIAIQAEAAPYTVPEVPDKIRQELKEIRATALDALTEMRRILGVLRSEDGAETAPQPGLDRLDALVWAARGAGLTVNTSVIGDLSAVPQGVALSAYRILQEALSNVMRHAPGAVVDVELIQREGILLLSVINGPPAEGRRASPLSPPGEGHGLVGMRERAAMLGGGVTAKPTPEGGFAVTATLPLRSAA